MPYLSASESCIPAPMWQGELLVVYLSRSPLLLEGMCSLDATISQLRLPVSDCVMPLASESIRFEPFFSPSYQSLSSHRLLLGWGFSSLSCSRKELLRGAAMAARSRHITLSLHC